MTFFVIFGWIMAFLMAVITWLAVRNDEPGLAAASTFTGLFVLGFAHWRKRQIQRARAYFNQMVADYERAISQPPF